MIEFRRHSDIEFKTANGPAGIGSADYAIGFCAPIQAGTLPVFEIKQRYPVVLPQAIRNQVERKFLLLSGNKSQVLHVETQVREAYRCSFGITGYRLPVELKVKTDFDIFLSP
jgi:hypothetical protein